MQRTLRQNYEKEGTTVVSDIAACSYGANRSQK